MTLKYSLLLFTALSVAASVGLCELRPADEQRLLQAQVNSEKRLKADADHVELLRRDEIIEIGSGVGSSVLQLEAKKFGSFRLTSSKLVFHSDDWSENVSGPYFTVESYYSNTNYVCKAVAASSTPDGKVHTMDYRTDWQRASETINCYNLADAKKPVFTKSFTVSEFPKGLPAHILLVAKSSSL
jgi:hypothetical protein